MSLVNDMLRNLDRRAGRVAFGRHDSLPPSADELDCAQRRAPLRAFTAVAGIAGAAALSLVWSGSWPTRIGVGGPAPIAKPAAPVPLPDVALAPIASPPRAARVERLALGQVADGTRLALELSRPTAHRVQRLDGGRGIELALEDAELGPDLPRLELRGTPVESFAAERVDGELRIRLTTSQPVRATSVMHGEGASARLELDLLADAPAQAAKSPPEATSAVAVTPRSEHPGRATELWRDALRVAARGDVRGAESRLREALELAPRHVGIRSALIALLLRVGRGAQAEAEITEGRTQSGDASAFASLAARVLLARGDDEGALAELERNPPAVDRDPEHHALLAAVRERLGRHAQAGETYRALLGVDPKRADWWLGLALAREGEGRPSEALVAYRAAAQLPGLDDGAARWVRSRVTALAPGS
jgi:MSHA biogenesis protein MshN